MRGVAGLEPGGAGGPRSGPENKNRGQLEMLQRRAALQRAALVSMQQRNNANAVVAAATPKPAVAPISVDHKAAVAWQMFKEK